MDRSRNLPAASELERSRVAVGSWGGVRLSAFGITFSEDFERWNEAAVLFDRRVMLYGSMSGILLLERLCLGSVGCEVVAIEVVGAGRDS